MEDRPLTDKILICVECNEEFVFTVSAQEYFLERGISEEPKRCKTCYMALKKKRRQQDKRGSKRTTPSHYSYAGNGNGRYRYNNGNYSKK